MSGSDLFGWDNDCYSMENSSDHKIEESVLSKFEKDRKKSNGVLRHNSSTSANHNHRPLIWGE